MRIILRQAKEADLPVIRDILNDGLKAKQAHDDNDWGNDNWTDDEVRERMKVAKPYLAYIGSDVIGTLSIQWEDETNWGDKGLDGQAGYIHRLAVKEGFHGKDLGGTMMDLAAPEIIKKGRKYLRLDCSSKNPLLCAYYEAHGFKHIVNRAVPAYDNYIAALYERAA